MMKDKREAFNRILPMQSPGTLFMHDLWLFVVWCMVMVG
jgi:hypothetical protein